MKKKILIALGIVCILFVSGGVYTVTTIQSATSELDQLIMDARQSDDQGYRKAVYKQALDVIIDWAVEIPNYQRQNIIIFSTERINIDTLTPDITTFWGWLNDVELIEMN